jgi:anti-anti-sigma regulatory factor
MEAGFSARAGELNEAGDKAVIDFSELTYVSSMGVRLLVITLKPLRQRRAALVTIRRRDVGAFELLQIAALTDQLKLVSEAAAVEGARGAAL